MKKMYRADMSIRMIITTNMITSMHAAARMIILTIIAEKICMRRRMVLTIAIIPTITIMNMNMSIIIPILTPA